MLRDMFKKTYTKIDMKYRAGEKESARTAEEDAPVIPAGLWKKCNKCGKPIYTDDVRANFYICLLYTSPSPRDRSVSRMPSSA